MWPRLQSSWLPSQWPSPTQPPLLVAPAQLAPTRSPLPVAPRVVAFHDDIAIVVCVSALVWVAKKEEPVSSLVWVVKKEELVSGLVWVVKNEELVSGLVWVVRKKWVVKKEEGCGMG